MDGQLDSMGRLFCLRPKWHFTTSENPPRILLRKTMAFLFVYSLVIFVFCKDMFSPVLCHFACRGNAKTEPVLWRGIALFSLLWFHTRSSPPAGYCTLKLCIFLLNFPLFGGTFMPTRSISSRDQPCGLACIFGEPCLCSTGAGWMLPQGAKPPFGTGTYGCTVSLSAPSEEGLCNPMLKAACLAKCVLQCGERGHGPWRAGKASGASACAPGKGAAAALLCTCWWSVPSSTASTGWQSCAAKGGQRGAPGSIKSAQWVRQMM